MADFDLTFHHLGLATPRPDKALEFLGGLGYRHGESIFDPEQNVNLIFCEHSQMPAVEIISPGQGGGPIDKMLSTNPNGLIYHPCYSSQDLTRSLARMEAAGTRVLCVSPPKPAILFNGALVSFYSVVGIGLIEILEGFTPRPSSNPHS